MFQQIDSKPSTKGTYTTDNGPDAMAGRRKLHSVRGREAFFVKTRPNRGCRKATEGR